MASSLALANAVRSSLRSSVAPVALVLIPAWPAALWSLRKAAASSPPCAGVWVSWASCWRVAAVLRCTASSDALALATIASICLSEL